MYNLQTTVHLLSSLGFDLQSQDEFTELLENLMAGSKNLIHSQGFYSHFSEENGVEVCFQVSKEEEVIGLSPYFRGTNYQKGKILKKMEGEGLKGYFKASILEKEVFFETPNFYSIGLVQFPEIYGIQLTAMGLSKVLYHAPKVSEAVESSEISLKKGGFSLDYSISEDDFVPFIENRNQNTEPLTRLGGVIEAYQKKRNSQAESYFHWLLLDCEGIKVELVLPEPLLEKEPEIGGFLEGEKFWLMGLLK